MDLKKCKNGHSYDPSITPQCPECAAMAGHTVPLNGGGLGGWDSNLGGFGGTIPMDSGFGGTVPLDGSQGGFSGADPIGKTQPIRRDTMPINPTPDHWSDPDDYRTAGMGTGAEGYNPTQPIRRQGEDPNSLIRPVTGWLVCVEGPDRGKDFRLHSDMNYVGRSKNNDVVLANDPTVSRERHAMVAYDNRGKMFFFAPANGSSLVRQNGRPVLSTVELKAGDRLEIGESIYMFVPLCGEDFEW